MAKSQYKPIQQIVKHRPDCAMLNGFNGDQPWCCPKQKTDWSFTPKEERIERDLSGRKNPRAQHRWIVVRCCDSDCPAKLAIYFPYFEKSLNLNSALWKDKE
jgi:hypothetical protein